MGRVSGGFGVMRQVITFDSSGSWVLTSRAKQLRRIVSPLRGLHSFSSSQGLRPGLASIASTGLASKTFVLNIPNLIHFRLRAVEMCQNAAIPDREFHLETK